MDKNDVLYGLDFDDDKIMKEVLINMVRNQKESLSNLIKLFIVVIVCYTMVLLGGIFGFFWYENQFETVTTETVTTMTTQEVSGESSEINNISGDMYKDNSVHNEGGE